MASRSGIGKLYRLQRRWEPCCCICGKSATYHRYDQRDHNRECLGGGANLHGGQQSVICGPRRQSACCRGSQHFRHIASLCSNPDGQHRHRANHCCHRYFLPDDAAGVWDRRGHRCISSHAARLDCGHADHASDRHVLSNHTADQRNCCGYRSVSGDAAGKHLRHAHHACHGYVFPSHTARVTGRTACPGRWYQCHRVNH